MNSLVFDIEESDTNIEIVSSEWVESKGRRIIFHL
jgi:chemotaxis receptor (MCP) glutamine deamidase CheD